MLNVLVSVYGNSIYFTQSPVDCLGRNVQFGVGIYTQIFHSTTLVSLRYNHSSMRFCRRDILYKMVRMGRKVVV